MYAGTVRKENKFQSQSIESEWLITINKIIKQVWQNIENKVLCCILIQKAITNNVIWRHGKANSSVSSAVLL